MRRLVLLASLGLATCSSPTALTVPEAPIGRDFTMSPGTTLYIEGSSTAFSFHRVESDSRCPVDAPCIDAGRAVVRFGIGTESNAYLGAQLRTDVPQPFHWGVFQIQLVRVEPYPRTTLTIRPEDYRATFFITG